MTRKEIDLCFERLHAVLQGVDLPTETQGLRSSVSAAEFMFMNYTYAGHIRFKHIDTRNYLILSPEDKLIIPLGGPFFKGFFDKVRP